MNTASPELKAGRDILERAIRIVEQVESGEKSTVLLGTALNHLRTVARQIEKASSPPVGLST